MSDKNAEGNVMSAVVPASVSPWGVPVAQNLCEALREEIRELKATLAQIIQTAVIPITTMAPEPYKILQSIPAVVVPAADGFNATFFDANIATSGDTQEEAFSNLRSLILDTFEYLGSEAQETLGPEPARQLAVLREFLKRE